MSGRRPPSVVSRLARALTAAALLCLAAACGAPGPLIPEQQAAARDEAPLAPAPTAYRVSRGDTLYSIAFRYGLDWREVAAWNGVAAPYTIRVGDRLRLRPPPDMRAAARTPGSTGSERSDREGATNRPAPVEPDPAPEDGPAASEPAASQPAATGPEPAVEPETEREPRASTPAAPIPDDATRSVAGVRWRWPTTGRISRSFDPAATRKGILIAGSSGQPIRAAAAGEVVYSGNGLIGYGELVIIKHSDQMLSAYAHNRERLVAEGERVSAGQLIGRMGRNERDDIVLHFEIRRDGKPDDPLDYLPGR